MFFIKYCTNAQIILKQKYLNINLQLTQTRGSSAQQKVRDVKQTQKQTNDSRQIWMYGHSRLHEEKEKVDDEKQRTKENNQQANIVPKSRIPRCATMQTKAQQNRNRQTEALNLEKTVVKDATKSQQTIKKKRDKSKTKKKRSPSKTKATETVATATDEVSAQPPIDAQVEEVEQAVPVARPQTKSQIEAQGDRVRELQEQMSNGESFLDKIGRPEPRRTRTTSSIFGPIAENLDPAPLDQSNSFRPVNGNRNTAPYIPGWSVVIDENKTNENGGKVDQQNLHNPNNNKLNKQTTTSNINTRSKSVTNVNTRQRRVSVNDVSDVEDAATNVPSHLRDPVPAIRPGTVTLKKRASVAEEDSGQDSES
jgi:hypothetical protein